MAQGVAFRVRSAIHQQLSAGPVPLRASIGVTAARGSEVRGEALLAEADRALYVAKRLGGDRVLAAGALDSASAAVLAES